MPKTKYSPVLPGAQYGRLTVVKKAEPLRSAKGHLYQRWECRCECGGTILAPDGDLRKGCYVSCGCWRLKAIGIRQLKHGESIKTKTTKEYRAWRGMLKRCYYPKYENYHNYGGRGVSVCVEWRNSFDTFLADMGRAPSPRHSIDRIDNEIGYCKTNCQWSLPDKQALNRRTTVFITYRGETRCVKDWARHLGMLQSTLQSRIAKGWPPHKAFIPPLKPNQQMSLDLKSADGRRSRSR